VITRAGRGARLQGVTPRRRSFPEETCRYRPTVSGNATLRQAGRPPLRGLSHEFVPSPTKISPENRQTHGITHEMATHGPGGSRDVAGIVQVTGFPARIGWLAGGMDRLGSADTLLQVRHPKECPRDPASARRQTTNCQAHPLLRRPHRTRPTRHHTESHRTRPAPDRTEPDQPATTPTNRDHLTRAHSSPRDPHSCVLPWSGWCGSRVEDRASDAEGALDAHRPD
jgi:hypothetical protein